jgi:hypothetical protein
MLKVYLSKILLFVLLTILTTTAFSRKFYFSSSTGNDSYSITQAQNPATPWKTLMKLQSLITNGNSTFLPGDTLAFKRGDTFANGYSSTSNPSYFTYVSCAWNNIPAEGYTAPSGTQANPIVLTNYGTGELPNFYYPDATIPTVGGSYAHNVFEFAGVSWIVIDGLQFNDTRFSATNKEAPSFTRSAILFGTWENSKLASNGTDTVWGSNRDTTNRKRLVRNCTVKNCNFNNISFAFGSIAGINCKISNNNITNLKSCTDTSGTYDVGAGAFEGVYGYYNEISHNYVKGAWGKSGRVSSTFGLFGVGVDIFCLKYSKINYNTFIDCSGAWEIGNLDRYDVNSGAWYDTFAYNKVINCGQLGYIHGGATNNDPFAGNNRNIACFNNVVINNNTSRMAGPKFGSDIYNDGQSFANWWFFRSPTKCVDNSLPVSNTTWSNPINPPYCNYGGHRFTVQYSTDVIKGNADTLVDLRNNIFYATTGDQIIYDASRTKFKHRNNIYYIKGGFLNPTTLGGTIGAGELVTTNQIFTDTTSLFPENWDLHLSPNSPAIGGGYPLGFSTDFGGTSISGTPDIGLFEFTSVVNPTPNPTPVNLNGAATQSSILCNGGTTTVTVSATGGTTPYSGTGTFTVSAGSYNYYIADAAGNRDTVSVVVNQPSVIAVTVASGTITTVGGTTTIQVNATGGTGSAYQYSLNGSTYQTSNIFTGVPAGNHVVNVKDINGCIVAKSFSISGPVVTTLIASSTSGTILCNGGTTTVIVSASGGVAPYTGTGSFTVSAGSRTYTVTDAAGNSATTSVNIAQPATINLTLNSGTIAVFGGSTTITVIANGGTGTLSYKLDNGTYQASNIFNNVLAGTHTVTVKDINSCTNSSIITITQPASVPLNANAIAGSILCNGSSTSVTVSATGGTAPYTGTGTFTVVAGTYAYSVTDANGNSSVANVVVTQPQLIIVSPVYGNITSNGGTTNVTVNATGGVSPFNYKMNNGAYQTSNIFSSVTAGTHLISVRDVNGCITTKTIVIAQPSALNVSATSGSISCNGGTTNVTISATGGTAPYTGTGNFIVSAGNYSYTVIDANGNSQSTSVTITQPTLLNATLTSGTISVYGGSTSINVSVSGGTAPYSYSLNNGMAQTTNIFNNVLAGNHSVLITDAKGCTTIKSITITQPSNNPIVVSAVSGQISCFGGTTMVTISATGGTAPYSGTGVFSAGAGVRTYTVRDAAGATQSTSITITQPTDIILTVSVASDISVIGGTTSVAASATGGAGTYRYSLDAGPSQTGSTFRSVGAGTHFITAVDLNGCSKMTTFTVNQVSSTGMALTLISKTDVTCKGGKDGTIEVKASGGREPFQYAIGTGNYQINNRFYGLKPGTYRVYAKDANNNIVNIVVVILDGKRPCRFGKTEVIINTYPNPTTTSFKLSIDATSDEEVYVEVMDLFGRKLFQEKGGADKIYNFGQNFKAGSYFVRVNQGEVQTTQKIIKQ